MGIDILKEYVDNELLIKLIVAALMGMAIGLERELRGKALGVKTSIVITISSCLLTIVSIEAAYTFQKMQGIVMDPLRLAAQIISGVGFIGAGVILRRNNDVISGLTTAAMIWGASGIGVAIGAGFIMEAGISLVLIIISVEVLPWVLKKIGPRTLKEKKIKLKLLLDNKERLTEILKDIKAKDIKISNVKVDGLAKDKNPEMELRILVHEKRYTTDVYYDVLSIEGVIAAKVELIEK